MKKLIRSLCIGLSCVSLGSALYAKADALDQIATPVSNPVNFEDPRIQSNIRPIFVYHKLDNKFVTGGGNAKIFALQLRYAVDDRLALIATKDGIVHLQPSGVLDDDTGLANVGAGAKYAFYLDKSAGVIGTAGLRFEAPLGAERVLQGKGAGMLNPFVSGAWVLGDECFPLNLVAGTGFRIRMSNHDSSFYDADLHLDTAVGPVSPMVELNLVQVLEAGDRLPIADEGQDFFNFGSSESSGKTMLTAAAGARVTLAKNVTWGTAYQFPLATGEGTRVTDWRLTTDLVYSF